MADQYDNLRPVADLRRELVERIFVSLQNAIRWVGPEPSDDDEKQSVYEAFADNMAKRLLGLTSRRLWQDRSAEWQEAYDKHGTGSTFVRAKIIGNDIYELAAPIPDIVPSPDRNKFFREVLVQLEEASEEVGAQLE